MDGTTAYSGTISDLDPRQATTGGPNGSATTTVPGHDAAAQAFMVLPFPMAVIDRRGRVVAINAAGEAEADFAAILGRTGVALARRCEETGQPTGISAPRTSGALWVVAAPMAAQDATHVLVTAVDPAGRHPAPAHLIAELCGLTPAEAQTARLVLAGESPKLIARTLRVSLATVKTHLHRVFAKTTTSGQPDLARRLARIIAPVFPSAAEPARGAAHVGPMRAMPSIPPAAARFEPDAVHPV